MSIASEISRLQTAKGNIKTAIQGKGVTVPSNAKLDSYNTYINSIIQGSVTGLIYEEGTFTPSENIARPTINFTNSHAQPPSIVVMYDTEGDHNTATNTNFGFTYIDFYKMWGVGIPYSSTAYRYELVAATYRGTSTSSTSVSSSQLTYNSDNTGDTNSTYARYYVTNTGFKPYSNSTSRYWRSGRHYKWVAIWK